MKRILKLFFVFIIIFISVGCKYNQTGDYDRFYLDDTYYNKGEFISVDKTEYESIEDGSYILFVHTNYCPFTTGISCEDVFKKFMDKYNIDFLDIMINEFKDTKLHDEVSLYPTIIIVNKGKVISYLDPSSDSDFSKYQDLDSFTNWINQYIYFYK